MATRKKMVKKGVIKRAPKRKTSIKTKIARTKLERKSEINKKIEAAEDNIPTLKLKTESEIALDFAVKTYKKFDKTIKSIILFGSTVKKEMVAGSDIDIVIVIDDVSIIWDQELIAWYREEMDKILSANPYQHSLHINTVKLSTWWEDLLRGDPVVINVIRYGEPLIDMGGFFEPLKHLLIQGKIKTTPEAVYTSLQRAPLHIRRSRLSELNAVEGVYWAFVDSAHAALNVIGVLSPSPEHIPVDLKEYFVDTGKLKMKYALWYRDILTLHKRIAHGEIKDLKGVEVDAWQDRAEEFLKVMIALVEDASQKR